MTFFVWLKAGFRLRSKNDNREKIIVSEAPFLFFKLLLFSALAEFIFEHSLNIIILFGVLTSEWRGKKQTNSATLTM